MAETHSLEQFVQRQLQGGKYQSYDALVEAGLRLLQEREEELGRVADALRPALDDYLRGDRGEEVDIEAIKAAGRERLAQSQASH